MQDMAPIGIHGGTGWLGLALGTGLLRAGLPAERLALTNRRGPTADYASWPGVVWAGALADLVAHARVLVLSVRPEDYRPAHWPDFDGLVISFLPGLPLARLAEDFPRAQLAIAMPGGGAREGRAHVPFCAAPGTDPAAVAAVLSVLGTVDQVADEAALAFMSALSGSGAAYPALMAQAMYAVALQRGIAPDVAWRAVESVVCDAPGLFRDGPEAAQALLDTYRGYRGITEAGIAAAEAAGLGTAIETALRTATEKALAFRIPG